MLQRLAVDPCTGSQALVEHKRSCIPPYKKYMALLRVWSLNNCESAMALLSLTLVSGFEVGVRALKQQPN